MRNTAFGPLPVDDGILFRLWAPKQDHVRIVIDGGEPQAMAQADGGWHVHHAATAGQGTRYTFLLEDGLRIPDPASRFQPDDVHGPSQVIDPAAYRWSETGWRGRAWHETVLYELHVGAFTPEGTFRAAAEKLGMLAELGVTTVEVMPIGDFPGGRSWGYDGVLAYAPDATYGHPDEFRAFVDAAHACGISVLLDVVYNHFGPDGNYLPLYAPLLSSRHQTPWGDGINYDGEDSTLVREFVIENALYWLDEFRLDGLRLDAVHSIDDNSREHLVEEIARRVRQAFPDRIIHLILEDEENDSRLIGRDACGKPLLYDAQWNDDMHHVLHVAATGETTGYYRDYAGRPASLARALAEGFVFQGEVMAYRGSERGRPSAQLPPTAFIAFIQNHDQTGNRAFGERLDAIAAPQAVEAIAAVYLLSPQIPMLFMGEEWACSSPFPYFCDFHDELNAAVRNGRRKELARLPGFNDANIDRVPDPTMLETFLSAKLDWQERQRPPHAARLALYRRLLAVRRRWIIPRLEDIGGHSATSRIEGETVGVDWRLGDGAVLSLAANLTDHPRAWSRAISGEEIWRSGSMDARVLEPWTVVWTMTPPGNDK